MTYPNNFYFWLGENAELESLTEKEFEAKQEAERIARRKWKDVDVVSGD